MTPPDTVQSPWRTLARFGLRCFLGLIILTLLWLLWYAYASHRLAAHLALYRARGEPAEPKGLAGPALPPGENAVEMVDAAADSLSLSEDEDDLVSGTNRPRLPRLPFSDADMASARTLLARQSRTFELLEQMRQVPRASWPFDPAHPETMFSDRHFGKIRQLANFCRAAALFYHQDGRDDLAFDCVAEMQCLARIVEQGHFLIDHLVSWAIDAICRQALLQMAPDLQIESPGSPHGIPRAEVQTLVTNLLDTGTLQEEWRECLRHERLYPIAEAESWHLNILTPMMRLDACRMLDLYDGILQASAPDVPSFRAAVAGVPSRKIGKSSLQTGVHFLSNGSFTDNTEPLLLLYRGMTDQQATALRLAIRLYELDHAGQLPPTLDSLVQAYLPAVPKDPFRNDGGPWRYLPGQRVFYSVNADGIDEGGVISAGAPSVDWNSPDAVYPIDRITAPASAPATRPDAPATAPAP